MEQKRANKQHAKSVRTKAAIQEAFVELVHEKGFNDLNVTDITRTANINRGTFYIHYVDKFDLLESLKRETLEDIKGKLDAADSPLAKAVSKESLDQADPGEHGLSKAVGLSEQSYPLIPYETILNALGSVVKRRELLMALISDQGDPSFVLEIRAYLKKKIEHSMPPVHEIKKEAGTIREDYLDIILYDEILSIITQWLKTGLLESPEEIAKLISETRFLSSFELFRTYRVVPR